MQQTAKKDSPRNLADLERAAWFARLAFGAPSDFIEAVPAMPPPAPAFPAGH